MLGWIMPDPFATPTMLTLRRFRLTVSPAALANVSVVRMQLATFSQSGAPSFSHTFSTPPETMCGGQRLADHAGGRDEDLVIACSPTS
jgi:hypothetical protein